MTDLPTVWRASRPKARKLHRCIECTGSIEPGEVYEKFTGLWDGSWDTYRTCAECNTLRGEVNTKSRATEDCVAFGELHQSFWEPEFDDSQRLRFLNNAERRGAVDLAAKLRRQLAEENEG